MIYQGFARAIIKTLHQGISSTLGTHENMESLSKETESLGKETETLSKQNMKRSQTEILEIKAIITKIQKSMDGLNSRMD